MVELSVSFVLAISTLQDEIIFFFSKGGKTVIRLRPIMYQKNVT